MFLRYGNYTHSNNEAGYKIQETILRSHAGVPYAARQIWSIRGDLLNYPTQAALSAAINQLRNFYRTDGGDLLFLEDDEQTVTADALYSANCIGGTRILQAPDFPDTYGSGEWQTAYGRSYTMVVQGDIRLTSANVTLQFKETLVQVGTGGESVVYLTTSENPPVLQNPSQLTPVTYVQSGSALGLYDYPAFPPPVLDGEVGEEHKEDQGSPQLYGQFHWPISWSYTFKLPSPVDGEPNPYPNP